MKRTSDAVSPPDGQGRRFLPAWCTGSVVLPIPAWVASLVLHAVVIVVVGLTMRFAPQGISGESTREVAGEIVLKHHSEQGDYYETQSDAEATNAAAKDKSSADLLDNPSPANPEAFLPTDSIGNPDRSSNGNAGSGKLLNGATQPRLGAGKGTTTKFFDIKSQGDSFVFVIDRSTSMGQGRLAAAKAELLAALSHLKKTNKFQIIFYNSKLYTFRPRGKLSFFADEPTKKKAQSWFQGITADGFTSGFRLALGEALDYGPDVIYFLTDAEDIRLSSNELARLRRRNRGSVINTIKFGEGAAEQVDWLVNLAKVSGGKYRYVDTGKFRSNR